MRWMTVMVESTASTQSTGAITPQLLEERAEEDEDDALGALHEADLA